MLGDAKGDHEKHETGPRSVEVRTYNRRSTLPSSHVMASRRTRRLTPWVVNVCLIMISGTFLFVVAPPPVLADSGGPGYKCIPCPGGPGCEPNCGPPPPCPTPYTVGLGSSVPLNSTNATILYWVTTSSPVPAAYSSLSWGLNTSYSWTAISNQSVGFIPDKTFLDFLDPSTKYYYHVHAWTTCTDGSGTHHYVGDYYGSWSTRADYMTSISGFVRNANGVAAPNNVWVQATCVNTYYGSFSSGGYTGDTSPGHYTISISGWQIANYSMCNGILIQVLNGEENLWTGFWNESVVVWMPQVVDFYLPSNYISPYFPAVLDFSNAAAGYSTISYSSGTSTSYTTSFEYSWSVGVGGTGGSGTSSTSKTYSEGSSGGFQQQGGALDYIAQMETTGTVEFNAISRDWAMTQMTLYGGLLNGEPAAQNPNFVQPSDWLTPMAMNQSSNTPKPYFIWNSGAGKYMEDVLDKTSGFYYTGGVTTSTTLSVTGGYSASFGLSPSLPGVGSVSLSVGAQWSQSSSTTYTQELTYSVGMPYGGSPICFDVIGQGGSSSPTSTTADMFGIYVWSPNAQGGCSTP
jgi:hypothetical protein